MRLRTTASVLAALLGSCADPYPLPPTPCDDYCYATQRAGCPEDDPRWCVTDCESAGVLREAPHCEDAWNERNACYLASPAARFSCVGEVSTPDATLCVAESSALVGCVSPLAGLCLEDCTRNEQTCGGSEGGCAHSCLTQGTECSDQAQAFYRCSLAAPVDCTPPEEDTRPIEEIPCIAEIGAWFACLDALAVRTTSEARGRGANVKRLPQRNTAK